MGGPRSELRGSKESFTATNSPAFVYHQSRKGASRGRKEETPLALPLKAAHPTVKTVLRRQAAPGRENAQEPSLLP
jgi:hypothetical protein